MGGFTAVIGDWGSGKTLVMTRWAYDRYLQGEKIITNYPVNFPHTYMTYQDFIKLVQKIEKNEDDARAIRNASIYWDEAAMGADAYEFLETSSKNLMTITSQLRKFDSAITFNVQRFNWIIRRMRQVTSDYFLMRDLDADMFDHRRYKCGLRFEITRLDKHQQLVWRRPKIWDGSYTVGLNLYDTKGRIQRVNA